LKKSVSARQSVRAAIQISAPDDPIHRMRAASEFYATFANDRLEMRATTERRSPCIDFVVSESTSYEYFSKARRHMMLDRAEALCHRDLVARTRIGGTRLSPCLIGGKGFSLVGRSIPN
jgi:hypothetical protein